MGIVGPPVDRDGGRARRRRVRPSTRGVRPRRRPRGQGDRGAPRVRPPRRRRSRALAPRPRGRGGEEHLAPGPRRARRGGDAPARRDRRGGEARPLVRGRQGARVRERGARRGRAGVRRAVRILLVNWNDRENPHAGGAEIHLHAMTDSTCEDPVRRGIPRQRVEVIYPGVDAAWYSPDGGTPRAGAPTFLYVGRLKRYKGVETAVRALALARAERPDVTLEIAGQGDDRFRLERLARALSQVDAVRFLGFVPDAEKRRLLRRAWAVVLPSQKEGWGISNVEAAACGTPALASDSPGLRESVRHGETGFLVPHGDERALADRMLALAAEPALVSRLGRGARAVAEQLSWARAARATEAHLHRVIAQGG